MAKGEIADDEQRFKDHSNSNFKFAKEMNLLWKYEYYTILELQLTSISLLKQGQNIFERGLWLNHFPHSDASAADKFSPFTTMFKFNKKSIYIYNDFSYFCLDIFKVDCYKFVVQ